MYIYRFTVSNNPATCISYSNIIYYMCAQNVCIQVYYENKTNSHIHLYYNIIIIINGYKRACVEKSNVHDILLYILSFFLLYIFF